MKPKPIPLNIVKEAFEISMESPSGLIWKVRPPNQFNHSFVVNQINSKYAGKPAGTRRLGSDGITRYFVCVCNLKFQTSRVVYAIHHGIDPGDMEVDHIDGNACNNAPSNLRLATRAENSRNRKVLARSKSGVTGVCWLKREERWQAQLVINGKRKIFGLFKDLQDAINARIAGEKEIFGAFSPKESRLSIGE